MTIVTRTIAKSYFETGDKPTQSQFIDLIDGAMFNEDFSTLGKAIVSAATTASAQNLLGIPGINPPGTVGNILLTAITTASAQNNIGGGAVGKILFETVTTASAQNQLDLHIPTTAAQSDQETGTSLSKYISPGVQQYHPSACKAWGRFTNSGGTPSISASYNLSSITDNGVGDFTINFTVAFSTANYGITAMLNDGVGSTATIAWYAEGTGSLGIRTRNAIGALSDSITEFGIAIFGDQ